MKTEKKLLLLTIGGFLIINLLLGGAFYYFYFVKVKEVRENIKKVTDEINAQQEKKKEIDTICNENERLQKIAEGLERKLPPASFDSYDKLINQIEAFCLKSNVSYSSISPASTRETAQTSQKPGEKMYSTMSVKMDVIGKFYDLVNFIYLIENETRLMKVDEFSFTINQSAAKEGEVTTQDTILTLSLQITAFVGAPKEAKK